MSEPRLKIESRHSDYGPDAGGYRVLRFDGVWVGRIDEYEAGDKLLAYIEELEQQVRVLREALEGIVESITRGNRGDDRMLRVDSLELQTLLKQARAALAK